MTSQAVRRPMGIQHSAYEQHNEEDQSLQCTFELIRTGLLLVMTGEICFFFAKLRFKKSVGCFFNEVPLQAVITSDFYSV